MSEPMIQTTYRKSITDNEKKNVEIALPIDTNVGNSVVCCLGTDYTLGDALDVIVVTNGTDKVATGDFRVKFPPSHVGKRVFIKVNGVLWKDAEMIVTNDACKFKDGMSEKPAHLESLMQLLHEERNEIQYQLLHSDDHSILGTADAHIFLWKSHYRIVVVDIDGTITKSNARGVWDTVITENYEYVHFGICQFFQQVMSTKHVRALYLTSRTMSMARATRRFLAGLQQDDTTLPVGPMMAHTGSLSTVLLSELIKKDIYQYKADSLVRQVVLVFCCAGRASPNGVLCCAFGNSPTDSMAYEMAGVHIEHIYNISKSSTITCLDKDIQLRSEDATVLHQPPTMKIPRKRCDYSRLFGTTYQGYGDVKLLQDVLTKMHRSV